MAITVAVLVNTSLVRLSAVTMLMLKPPEVEDIQCSVTLTFPLNQTTIGVPIPFVETKAVAFA